MRRQCPDCGSFVIHRDYNSGLNDPEIFICRVCHRSWAASDDEAVQVGRRAQDMWRAHVAATEDLERRIGVLSWEQVREGIREGYRKLAKASIDEEQAIEKEMFRLGAHTALSVLARRIQTVVSNVNLEGDAIKEVFGEKP